MKITEEEVRYVAELANLRLTDEEIPKLRADLDGILGHIEKLNELDTTGVEPMAQVLYAGGETAALREDISRPGIGQKRALMNAPQAGAGHFKVPKVFER